MSNPSLFRNIFVVFVVLFVAQQESKLHWRRRSFKVSEVHHRDGTLYGPPRTFTIFNDSLVSSKGSE